MGQEKVFLLLNPTAYKGEGWRPGSVAMGRASYYLPAYTVPSQQVLTLTPTLRLMGQEA